MAETAPARSITKPVTIDRPAAEVHAYLADARNWPLWSVVNALAVPAGPDPDWWQMTTPAALDSSVSGLTLTPACSITTSATPGRLDRAGPGRGQRPRR